MPKEPKKNPRGKIKKAVEPRWPNPLFETDVCTPDCLGDYLPPVFPREPNRDFTDEAFPNCALT